MACWWDGEKGLFKFEWASERGITKLIDVLKKRFKARHCLLATANVPWAIHDIANDINHYLKTEPELLQEEYDNVRVSPALVRRAIEVDSAAYYINGSTPMHKFELIYMGDVEHWLIEQGYVNSLQYPSPGRVSKLSYWETDEGKDAITLLIISALEKTTKPVASLRVADEVRKSCWLSPWIMDIDHLAVMPSYDMIYAVLNDPFNTRFARQLSDCGNCLWSIREI